MLNEFRQDLVSGDWVLFATGRAKGHIKKKEKFYQPKEGCPFEDLAANGNEEPVLVFHNGKHVDIDSYRQGNWSTLVVPNKSPAVSPGEGTYFADEGPYKKAAAIGFHELVITKDHDKSFCCFNNEEMAEVLTVYRDRFREIIKKECGEYILIFHNRGPGAGGTIYHNHSQILSTPILPPEILRSITGSENFYKKNNKRVYDVLLEWEQKEKRRVIYENEGFICFCPFVSKTPYEIRIFPKISSPRFELIAERDVFLLADALSVALKKIDRVLDEPDFNFYIHTAPIKANSYSDDSFYHWHVEIVPRLSIIGGLELGADVYVNVVDPDEAADLLRKNV